MAAQQYSAFYVSLQGSDYNPGTEDQPFATLNKAKDTIRQLRKRPDSFRNPISIIIRAGIYYLQETVCFNADDSGTAESPLIICPYPGEEVIFCGAYKLDVNWSNGPENIQTAQISQELNIDQLYINGNKMHMARYPSYDGQARIYNGYAANSFDAARVSKWSKPQGGYIHAMHKHMWGDYHYLITGKDALGVLQYEGGWQNNRQMGMHDQYRYVENIREELDCPNEWYYDKTAKQLLVYSEPGTNLATATVEAVHLRHLIILEGTIERPVKHIQLEGIQLRHAARTFMDNREPLQRSDWTVYRGGAVIFRGTENCSLENCSLSELGGNAIFVDQYNRNVVIRGCHIHEIGANGISFVGDSAALFNPLFEYEERQSIEDINLTRGPQTVNYPSACTAEDCLIHRTGRIEKQSAPVQISTAASITVRHCSIYDVPRAGINISEGTWGGHVIEHCDVFSTVQETGDHGSFNSWGRDRFWGLKNQNLNELNKTEITDERSELPILDMLLPNTIRNNRWRCDYGWDIDLDDGSSFYHIYNNLCLSGGIKLREGFYRVCENNIMVNNTFHPHVWYTGSQDVFRRNIVFTPYEPIQVPPQTWGHECDWNFYHLADANEQQPAILLQELSGCDKQSLTGNADFLNPAAGDYRVSETSACLKLGFENFAMDLFGVQKPELKAIAKTPKLPEPYIKTAESSRDRRIHKWAHCNVKNVVGMGDVSASGLYDEIGVWIETIPFGSWQGSAGLEISDVILQINEDRVGKVEDLIQLYEALDSGDSFEITVFRGQKAHTLSCIKP